MNIGYRHPSKHLDVGYLNRECQGYLRRKCMPAQRNFHIARLPTLTFQFESARIKPYGPLGTGEQ